MTSFPRPRGGYKRRTDGPRNADNAMTLFISRMGTREETDGCGWTGGGTIALSGNLTFFRPGENWELGEMGERGTA